VTTTDMLLPENAVEIVRGTSKTLELTIYDDDLEKPEPVDITGATLIFTVKHRVEDAVPLIQKKSTDSAQIVLIAPREGRARIYLVPADTQNLEPKPYVFDVWLILTGKRYAVVAPSIFEVHAGVTLLPL